ncbi:MAG TPA: VWA domain-containing protein [Vicinamibacteria bacterium]
MFRLSLLGLAGTLALQPSPPTFPAAVELVTVDAVVLDREGRPVPGLARDDFVVTEDGKPLEIVSFEAFVAEPGRAAPAAPSAPSSNEPGAQHNGRAFAIILDDLRIASARVLGARQAAASFLERSVRDGDEVTLGTTSGELWWSARIPEGREDLLAVLTRVRGRYLESTSLDRMTDYEAFWINTHESSPAMAPLLPDRPASAPAAAPTLESNPLGASIKERVKQRWKDLNLCTGSSCEGMVRDRAADLDGTRRSRTELTLRAVRRGLDALAPIRGRKSLLLLSEGFIDDPASDLRGVEAASREANTAVYFIDTRGLAALPGGGSAADAEAMTQPRDRLSMGFEDAVLESAGASALAEGTGGFSVRNTNDLAAGADRIAEESRVFYLLGFYPPERRSTRDWRKLRVEVKRPSLEVRARRGYMLRAPAAPKEAKAGKKGSKQPTLDPAVVRALESAHDAADIPLRLMTYVLEPRSNGTTHVVVAAEFDGSRLGVEGKGQARAGRLELSILATHRDSGREFRFDDTLALTVAGDGAPAWRALAREFELPPGVAQARVVLRDPASGALGSVSQRFEVPPAGALHLSTPIVTDHIEPGSKAQSHPRPALAAHRVFRPEGALYIQFEVFGAARAGSGLPRVTAGLALRTRDGRLVRQAPPTPIVADPDGRVVRFVGMPLDGLEEGPYDLMLEVRDEVSDARLLHREAFTLAR